MTAVEDRAVRADELLARARELGPMLAAHAERGERDRRLAPEVVDALRDAGLFKLTAPRRAGGYEVDVRTFLDVCAEVSRGDGSAGWVMMLMNTGGYLMGFFGDRARDDVYGYDPDAAVSAQLAPSATARPVEGGYAVDGRWAWASGSHWAQWNLGSIPIVDERGELTDLRQVLVPTSELTIEDTWFAAGMAGTASNTFVAEEVFVPEYRTLSIFGLVRGAGRSEHADEPLYRAAGHLPLVLGHAAPMLGLARAAFGRVLATVQRDKPVAASVYQRSIDSPSYRLSIADAAALIDSADLHVHRSADQIDAAARAGAGLDTVARTRIRSDVATAALRCREAVGLLLNVAGASAFASADPMQRMWRDLEIICRHALVNVDLAREMYGRALLGIEEQVSPLI